MVYHIQQKCGVRFTIRSDKTPQDMFEAERNLGSGLAYLWTLVDGKWVEVLDQAAA